jgi:hypothetical protein
MIGGKYRTPVRNEMIEMADVLLTNLESFNSDFNC